MFAMSNNINLTISLMYNAEQLIASGAYLLDTLTNSAGQQMNVYEHPVFGERWLLLKFNESGNCYQTSSLELPDLRTDDYEMIEVGNEIKCGFEVSDYDKFTLKFYGKVN
jgi:hypothetical protein